MKSNASNKKPQGRYLVAALLDDESTALTLYDMIYKHLRKIARKDGARPYCIVLKDDPPTAIAAGLTYEQTPDKVCPIYGGPLCPDCPGAVYRCNPEKNADCWNDKQDCYKNCFLTTDPAKAISLKPLCVKDMPQY